MDSITVEYQRHHIFLHPSSDPWSDQYDWSIFSCGEELIFGAGFDPKEIISDAKQFIDSSLLAQ